MSDDDRAVRLARLRKVRASQIEVRGLIERQLETITRAIVDTAAAIKAEEERPE